MSRAKLSVAQLEHRDRQSAAPGLFAMEQDAVYPLGDDTFRIDHGADPFAFFDRMGRVSTWLAHETNESGDRRLVGLGTGIVRSLPDGEAWYVCDVKVLPQWRRTGVARKMALRALPVGLMQCARGYFVAMLPQDGAPAVVRLVDTLPDWVIAKGPQVEIYSFPAAEADPVVDVVRKHRGTVRFANNFGTKDIVLTSTGQPMALWHCQFGPLAQTGRASLPDDATAMFCTPLGDPLDADLKAAGFAPSAAAQVMHRKMGEHTFEWLLTSDI